MKEKPLPKIPFFFTHISEKAIAEVTSVLRSGWLNEGEVVKLFEQKLADVLGVSHPVTVNSGTSALHLALVLAGVGPGDEVIVPPQTFIATGLVVLMTGARPVFADIDPETGNIHPDAIVPRITSRTKAIIPVHWGGYPCDLDEIHAIAGQFRLTVIEDAAHALGAIYKGRPIGSISRYTAFSFQAIKHLTTGDGGMLCCRDAEDAREATIRRWFGIDRTDMKRSILGDRGYDISVLGFKYHMNNVAAALGVGNLTDFPERLTRRRKIACYYRERLADMPGLALLRSENDRIHAYWQFSLLVDDRLDFVTKLSEQGIPASVIDLRIDTNSVFGGIQNDLPGQRYFNERHLALPCHEGLADTDVDHIVDTIRKIRGPS